MSLLRPAPVRCTERARWTRRLRLFPLGVGLLGTTLSALTSAQPAAAPRAAATASAVPAPSGSAAASSSGPLPSRERCTVGERSALVELACELRNALGALPPGSFLAEFELELGARPEREAALKELVSALIVDGLGVSRVKPKDRGGLAVRVELRRDGTRVNARVDARQLRVGVWERAKGVAPRVLAHGFASRPFDVELRSYLPKPAPLLTVAARVAAPEPELLALACGSLGAGSLGADGAQEVALVGRKRVRVGRVEGKQFVTRASVRWRDLTPVAGAPLREPLGGAAFLGEELFVATSDRSELIVLDRSLAVKRRAPRQLPWPTGGCVEVGSVALQADATCEPKLALEGTLRWSGSSALDALAAAKVRAVDGSARWLWAARHADSTRGTLQRSHGRELELTNLGAQLALGDADGDGTAEFYASAPTLDGRKEELLVADVEDGRLHERQRLSLRQGVRALTVCEPTEPGLRGPVVVATRDELVWLR